MKKAFMISLVIILMAMAMTAQGQSGFAADISGLVQDLNNGAIAVVEINGEMVFVVDADEVSLYIHDPSTNELQSVSVDELEAQGFKLCYVIYDDVYQLEDLIN